MNKELIPQTSIMQKEFIPYEQALDLESIGFDTRPNFSCYYGNQTSLYNKEGRHTMYINYGVMGSGLDEGYIYAPTFSQAFRFFRERCELYHNINPLTFQISEEEPIHEIRGYTCEVKWINNCYTIGRYNTYEEAELVCLKKLIDIVKNK